MKRVTWDKYLKLIASHTYSDNQYYYLELTTLWLVDYYVMIKIKHTRCTDNKIWVDWKTKKENAQ